MLYTLGCIIPMASAIGMIASQGMEVGCPIGMRLWMNHIGFVFLTLGGLPSPKVRKTKLM